jgi:hypothetical protein
MRTIPNRIRSNWPKGTYQARCDYCNAQYMRHQLRRNEAGFLACPDDRKGRDEVQLTRMNAEHAASIGRQSHVNSYDGGADGNQADLPVIHRTTAADIGRITE